MNASRSFSRLVAIRRKGIAAMFNRALPIISLTLFLVPSAVRSDPVKMSRTWKKDDVAHIKVETTIDDLGAKIALTSKSTVISVKDNGQAVLEMLDEAG